MKDLINVKLKHDDAQHQKSDENLKSDSLKEEQKSHDSMLENGQISNGQTLQMKGKSFQDLIKQKKAPLLNIESLQPENLGHHPQHGQVVGISPHNLHFINSNITPSHLRPNQHSFPFKQGTPGGYQIFLGPSRQTPIGFSPLNSRGNAHTDIVQSQPTRQDGNPHAVIPQSPSNFDLRVSPNSGFSQYKKHGSST